MYPQSCATITTIHFKTLLSPLKETLYLFVLTFVPPSPSRLYANTANEQLSDCRGIAHTTWECKVKKPKLPPSSLPSTPSQKKSLKFDV